MTERDGFDRRRRRFLAGSAASVSLAVAGCLGGGGQQETLDVPTSATGTERGDTLPAPVLGDPAAAVTVLVFEDFACPHCRDYALDVAPEVVSEYADPGDIRYEYHDFPIPVDEQVSWDAACAARAVQAVDGDEAFFEYANALFENQSNLGPDTYERLASELGLDGEAIRRSAVERTHRPTVEADRAFAERVGVRGTPTVAVNGAVVRPTVSAISTAIDDELA